MGVPDIRHSEARLHLTVLVPIGVSCLLLCQSKLLLVESEQRRGSSEEVH